MPDKIQFFEQATTRLRDWINESKQRSDDFFAMDDVGAGETIRVYLARNAYKQDIFQQVIIRLLEIEKERTIKSVCTL